MSLCTFVYVFIRGHESKRSIILHVSKGVFFQSTNLVTSLQSSDSTINSTLLKDGKSLLLSLENVVQIRRSLTETRTGIHPDTWKHIVLRSLKIVEIMKKRKKKKWNSSIKCQSFSEGFVTNLCTNYPRETW